MKTISNGFKVLLRQLVFGIAAAVLLLSVQPAPTAAADPTITEHANTLAGSNLTNITTGPDGALWFAEQQTFSIGRITTAGDITHYPVSSRYPYAIVTGPDGALWFTEELPAAIGRITTSGEVTEYPLPFSGANPRGITTGPDGALWFTQAGNHKIGRITTSGAFTEFSVPTASAYPEGIVTGPDGALWFTEKGTNKIGRITTGGSITEYETPTANSFPFGITVGSDGALWFTENNNGQIGRITTSGVVTEYAAGAFTSGPVNITSGPDGALWFTQTNNNLNDGNKIGRMTTSGAYTGYAVPTANAHPFGITSGPDGALWFTEASANKIGRITTPAPATPAAPTGLTAPSPTNSAPQLSWSAVAGADHYAIYRGGDAVGTSTSPGFVDSTATEGSHSYHVTAVNAGGESGPSNTAVVVLDITAPVLGMPTWSANPVAQGTDTTMSVTADDTLSGVAQVSYSIENGPLQPMTYNSGLAKWQATFGASLSADSHSVDIIATDAAGNTASTTDALAVYNAANGYVTGHAKVLPTASDTMPIALDTSNNPAKLVAGFTNVTSPASGGFDVSYVVKQNKDEFTLTSTAINWVIAQDSTHASILGRANLSVFVASTQTVTQNVSVRFDIVLGTNGNPDHLTIKVFSPSANPNTAAPLYIISDVVLVNGSNLMIHP